jgi:hypothetical protein
MLKRLVRLCSILTVLSTGGLFASHITQPGSWEISGDFLYLLPTVDDTYFVVSSDTAVTGIAGTRHNNDFNFHPGFRVDLKYGFCECDKELALYYTWLGCHEDTTVSGNFLGATVGSGPFIGTLADFPFAGAASSHNHLLYERVDALLGQQVYDNCCGLSININYGLEYAFLRLHEDIAYEVGLTAPTILDVARRSRTWGIGPEFGVDLYWELWQNCGCAPGTLSLHFASSGSILASQTDTKYRTTIGGVLTAATIDVRDEDTWRLIPAVHAKIGLNYEAQLFSCWQTSLEVGYEFNSYFRGISRTIYDGAVAGVASSFNDYYNLDVQGLYVSLAVGF